MPFATKVLIACIVAFPLLAGGAEIAIYDWPTEPGEAVRSDKFSVRLSAGAFSKEIDVLMSSGWTEEDPTAPANQYLGINYGGPRLFRDRTFSWATFSSDFESPVTVEVTKLYGEGAPEVDILPSGYNVTRKLSPDGRTVTFQLNRSRYVVVHFKSEDNRHTPDGIQRHMMALFADPLVENIPDKTAPGTLVFGPDTTQADISAADTLFFEPGFYDLRGQLNPHAFRVGNEGDVPLDGYLFLKAGQTLYASGGAFIVGKVTGAEPDTSAGARPNQYKEVNTNNVQIRGRGAFSGRAWPWILPKSIAALIHLSGNNILVEGIHGFDNDMHGINPGFSCTMRNVKVWGWHYNNDGFRPWGGLVEHCFSRPVDDAFYVGGQPLVVRDTVIWQAFNGAVVTCGWGGVNASNPQLSNGYDTRDFIMEDCHIIAPEWQGLGNNNGILASQLPHHRSSSNIRFERVRVDGNVSGLTNLKRNESQDVYFPANPGGISNVVFKDVAITGQQVSYNADRSISTPAKSLIRGSNGFLVSDLTFENLSIGGDLVTEANHGEFFTIEGDTQDIAFAQTPRNPPAPHFTLRVEMDEGQATQLEFPSVFGLRYQMLYSTDLQDWTAHDQVYIGTGEPIWIPASLILPESPATFFCRIVHLP